MRYIYSVLFYLALPYVFLRLLWRSIRSPDYRKRLGERIGFFPFSLEKCIWVHAVSVGETIAAIPLIKALKNEYTHYPILVTTMTPTGYARVKQALGSSVEHVFLPYDLPSSVNRFLQAMQPVMGIIMETELWPNLLAACQKNQIPVVLTNARLSEKSAQGYQRVLTLTKNMLANLTAISAHGEKDAARFLALGAKKEQITVTGNLKFDLEISPAIIEKAQTLRAELGEKRFIWIAASTHEGEEEIILKVHAKLRAQDPTALLILVPRHPDRFDTIFKLSSQSFSTIRRSQKMPCGADTGVYLGDTMGELLVLYGAADVAFVGGSLIPRGGHNMLEPAALGKPILTGPHVFNFAEISDLFVNAKALEKVPDEDGLLTALSQLLRDPSARQQMGENATHVIEANRGALGRQLEVIQAIMQTKKLV